MNKIILIAMMFASITLNAQTFVLKSLELGGQASEKQVFNSFGCNGKNLSPQLFWESAPSGTKSFAGGCAKFADGASKYCGSGTAGSRLSRTLPTGGQARLVRAGH